ncbi:spore photoproduct lyase family protein [Terrisporobacter mayombei]|uniref:Spore photoproduct lyase n=1 Tax=Terrisporobacter mayombei TaxID=1541 RepID=A0ABY9Q815_9FIRM|nr:spore photoproduct lyase [Terrisporobacter mayombei]MCC3869711.1 spore photoproduct lyase [Terrisporobacter mayombei]WMT83349.1 Spore photoproduct lyase [Terrisporobacter mayombei]
MFVPQRIIFEKGALNYEIGKNIYQEFKNKEKTEIINLTNNKDKEHIPGDNIRDFYKEGKNTLVVGVKKGYKFQSCKPSAHWQLPLFSGCLGNCQYCYLNTNLGDKPYIKVNVNIDDILDRSKGYMDERKPKITIFEGSGTSDPIPVEPYTHSLKRAIEFFAKSEYGRFRFVTKFDDVDTLLDIEHRGKTEARFAINTIKVIEDYRNLLIYLNEKIPNNLEHPITFEVISHRYTTRAKNIINEVFPDNILPMKDDDRTYKYGQFGYGKFVYPKENLAYMKKIFTENIEEIFPDAEIKYII